MNTVETILTRRSIREYKDTNISDKDLETILKAGQAGPSCADTRDFSFIVVKDNNMLNRMADANGIYADPLRKAASGILVCGDLNRAFEDAKDYWIIDCSIACQNMILAAKDLGIGTCWLGTYPQMERVKALKELFKLPEDIVPHSIISFGYPEEENNDKAVFEKELVHYEKW